MSPKTHSLAYPLICMFGLVACGGGGGGGSNSPPPPPPAGDTTAPDTTLSSTPPVLTNQVRASFGATSNEPGAVFEISLNGAAYLQVAAIFALDLLPDGQHSLNVRARDAAGNVDPTPANFRWTVDTRAPDTTMGPRPAPLTNQSRARFEVDSNEPGAFFDASLDGGAYTQVTAIFAFSNLPDGEHSVNVRARDAAGNIDETPVNFRWTVDTQAPNTSIATTTTARTRSAAATFTLTSTETGGSFEASIDGAAYASVSTPLSLTGLADGAHSVSVRALDAAANVDPTPGTFTWEIDSTPPTARVVFPTPVSYTSAAQLHVRGTALDASSVASLRVNGVTATSSDAFAHWSALVPLTVGDNALVVSVTDDLGNTNAAAASVAVANRGVVVNDIRNLAFDSAANRVLMTDPERRALLSARTTDRFVSVISDATRGTGIALQQPAGLVLDGSRALITDTSSDSVIAIDLATGNRTQLSAPAVQPDMQVTAAIAYHAPTQRAFVPTPDGTILAIDLANGGTRTVFSGVGVGTGIALDFVRGIALDPTSSPARLLVTDGGVHALIAIDLATGNRSVISYAAPLDPNNQVGSGPSVYSLGQFAVDAVAQRVLVPDQSASAFVGRLFSIDLATGNRTVLTASTSDVELRIPTSLAFDSNAGQVYVGLSERARAYRYDVASTLVTPFIDSNVGSGYVLVNPSGVLLDDAWGSVELYSPTLFPIPTIYRTNLANGTRFSISNYLGTGGAPTFSSPGNLVADTRPGMEGKALFLDTPFNTPVIRLNSVDLFSGALSVVASAPFPDYRFMSRMALDTVSNRVIVGLTNPAGGAGSVVAMDLSSGNLTTLASLSVGNGPPMYELGAVAVVPDTFGTTARVLVGTDFNLLAVNGSGDRSFIAAAGNIGSGPALVKISDMMVDFPGNRALVVGATAQAMQWVDLTSGNRTMASGRNPDDQTMRGDGPPLSGPFMHVTADLAANIAYVTAMQTIILAVDLDSGDRVIISR